MSSRHYDVVVLGRTLGALTVATLLARREFRVLLLGQGDRSPSYAFDRHRLKRRAFTFLFGQTPAWRKVLHDLAQSQSFRRRALALDPMFTFLSEERRLEIAPDPELFGKEIDREFPEVRQLVDELYLELGRANSALDHALDREIMWPPGTFFERLEAGRVAASLTRGFAAAIQDTVAKFPPDHPYRTLAALPARYASDLDLRRELPLLADARLHGSWIRGLYALTRSEDELEDFLIERFKSHGGECRLERRANLIVVQRGRVTGVREDGEEDAIGTSAIVSSGSGEALAELAEGEGITATARRNWPRLVVSARRFITNVVVKTRGLPDLLGQESFLLPPRGTELEARLDSVHLQRFPASQDDETLLVAEAILPQGKGVALLEAREAVLTLLEFHFPFLEAHLVAIDSPHDGLPGYDYSSGQRREVDRIHISESSSAAEAMDPLVTIDPPGFLELAGEPLRGPVPGTFLTGRTVLPGLGQEGQLLAAWSVTKLLTKKDAPRQRHRRQMWSKIETS